MSLSDFVEFVMQEIKLWDYEILGWESVQSYFRGQPEGDNCQVKELIAMIETRAGKLRTRREQLCDLLYQISGLEEVTA